MKFTIPEIKTHTAPEHVNKKRTPRPKWYRSTLDRYILITLCKELLEDFETDKINVYVMVMAFDMAIHKQFGNREAIPEKLRVRSRRMESVLYNNDADYPLNETQKIWKVYNEIKNCMLSLTT